MATQENPALVVEHGSHELKQEFLAPGDRKLVFREDLLVGLLQPEGPATERSR